MKRKRQLYEEMRALEHELKELDSIVKYDDTTPTEDEIHGWAIRMSACVTRLEEIKEDVLEFYKN